MEHLCIFFAVVTAEVKVKEKRAYGCPGEMAQHKKRSNTERHLKQSELEVGSRSNGAAAFLIVGHFGATLV